VSCCNNKWYDDPEIRISLTGYTICLLGAPIVLDLSKFIELKDSGKNLGFDNAGIAFNLLDSPVEPKIKGCGQSNYRIIKRDVRLQIVLIENSR
jgi:hypothetical protein